METRGAGIALEYFAGKKITLMGLGLLGRGLGDANFFAEAGAELIVTDLKNEIELAASVAALTDLQTADGQPAKIIFHLGGHLLEDFENRDLIIRAPNAPLNSPFIAHAREHGIPIEMDAALFVKLAAETAAAAGTPAPTIVGVTGTRGKSTTTHLIYEMARQALPAGSSRSVYLGGNVKDTATLPLIEVVGTGDIVVLELDSWQLQGFAEDCISPHIAVWTNFMPDHMNYYHGDMDRYFADKAAIARFQKSGDVLIAPREIKERIEAKFFSNNPLTGKYIDPLIATNALPADWQIALPGVHNRANAACAVAAARALNIPDEIIKKVLKTFTALPNRLELLGEKNGIAFYNDSNATTPDATAVALQTLTKPIVLIAGGNDKELDCTPLARELARMIDEKKVKKIILFNGKASEKLKALLPENVQTQIVPAANMDDAFAAALAAATSGDIILLSPAATSFGLFQNEYDRGEQFRTLFQKLK